MNSAALNINPKYFDLLTNESKILILYGAGGTGKSYFAAQKIVYRLLSESNHRILCLRKYFQQTLKSVYQQIKDVVEHSGLSEYFTFKLSPREIICNFNKNSVLFFGLEDASKLKSLAEITSVWIEEADQITLQDYTQVLVRLRNSTKNYAQVILTFNPTSVTNWIYKLFFAKEKDLEDDVLIVKTDHSFNHKISLSYLETLRNMKDYDYNSYKVYFLGEWGSLEERVFMLPNFFELEPKFVKRRFWGLDFGYTNPAALVEVCESEQGYYISEKFYEKNLTEMDILHTLNRIIVNKNEYIYADAAGASTISFLKRNGFVNIQSAEKNVDAGISYMRSIWKELFFNIKSQNLIKEIEGYRYMKDKDNNIIEKVLKKDDHAVDALRYALFTDYQRNINKFRRELPNYGFA